jgi:hypothetical protein
MSTDDDRELADLLRRALHQEADRQVPAGDGLIRIRERVDSRRRRLTWLRPALAVGAVAAVAAAVAVLPTALRQAERDGGGTQAAGPASGTRTATTLDTAVPGLSPSTAAPSTAPPSAVAPSLPAAAGVADMRTVWPYGSRAEGYYNAAGDVSAGRHPELTDPAKTAVSFVRRYVGPTVTLEAGESAPKDRGIGVVVNRTLPDGSSHPVTRVYLVQVSKDDGAPYVVAAADRPELGTEDATTLTVIPPADPLAPSADHVLVTGTTQRPATDPPTVKVEVRDADGAALSFIQATRQEATPELWTWSADVSLDPGQVGRAVTIAAWTVDDNADVLEFVATPLPLSRYAPSPTATR